MPGLFSWNKVPDKYPTFVLCDYHGNSVAPNVVLKKGISQKIDPKKRPEPNRNDKGDHRK